MPRKGTTLTKKSYGDLSDSNGLAAYRERYLEWMGIRNYSDKSKESRELYINYFIQWCEERGLTQPAEITKQIIERYQRYLYHYRKENGEPLSFQSQHSRLGALRAFFKYLSKQNYTLYNPAADIELPKLEKRLPKHVLTVEEVNIILNIPDLNTAIGLRDRAILEVFYSTGIRRSELINLRLYDLDRERGTLMVRLGKGNKDRMVPIGQRAINWCDKYLMEVRPQLYTGADEETLFLTHLGESFTPARMSQVVRNLIKKSDIGKSGSCHLFRHTMATQMLENGADIRYIQEMLGHAKVDTTQIYTQVSIRRLKEIHDATHPAKNKPEL
ncbi:site-specific tyrosine recombinase XerC [Aliikangiella maris]|uniref:Site-specific tyrosine recombinase XerC n=1 Tax=Aliikangiella maris TaxID=3162458 RepID=A0ABV3MV50_9GAMM